jgi:hypothetical protein
MTDIERARRNLRHGLSQSLESEIRMIFNEAMGDYMSGDGGTIISSTGHALDLLMATEFIRSQREENLQKETARDG